MDLSRYQEHYSLSHRLKRYCWYIVNRTLFRLLVTNAMKVPRNLLLRLFGANIPLASLVYPSSKIWAPWNLSVGEYACIGPDTEIYNKAPISIGNHAVISQGAFLCTASHLGPRPRPYLCPHYRGRPGMGGGAGLCGHGGDGWPGSRGRSPQRRIQGCGSLDGCGREPGPIHQTTHAPLNHA